MNDKTQAVQGSEGSKTVTVACKLPHGLLLRVFDMRPTIVEVIGGGKREVTEAINADNILDAVKINGYAAPNGKSPRGIEVVGIETGYALTHGVPRKFFERWLEENKDSHLVKKGLIFAADGPHRARDMSSEREKEKNGMEPLDPANLPRVSRRMKVKKYDKNDNEVARA